MLLMAVLQMGISWWWIVATIIIYVHTLILGAIYIRWNFYLYSFDRGTDRRYIALTFDDGPAAMTGDILDILKEKGVEAAFFSIGKHAAQQPEIVRRWVEEGHIVGNHSYFHSFHFDWQSAAKMTEELEQTNALVASVTGKRPHLFRPPYGVTNPNLAKAVARTGMVSIGWNVRSFDTTAKDGEQLLARILNKLEGGDIILLHDSMPVTCEILTELIDSARQKGFTFVRLDKMLGIDAYA